MFQAGEIKLTGNQEKDIKVKVSDYEKKNIIPSMNEQFISWGFSTIEEKKVTPKRTVKIAVIDSGIDKEHPDLKGMVTKEFNSINNTAQVEDDTGHGTAVAGIIAAIGALNLYSGVLWIAGYIAEQQPKNKRFYHYQARTVNNKYGIFVGPGLSYTKAVARLKSKGNIWSISSYYAQKAAKAASSYSDTLHHSAHSQRAGIRTYNHYHPKGLLGVHSFYGQGRLN
ncbi:MAG TPA: hypothetical protein DDY49_01130 [Paenibacillaceae bacterium]|nr:hypothetical protein [Paenibacillaceae bacterium]